MTAESPRRPAIGAPISLAAKTATVPEVLRAQANALEQGRAVVAATVLRRRGSTPATPGQRLALIGESELWGTVGGGALEQDVVERLLAMSQAASPEPAILSVDLRAAYGMACGGAVELLIEPLEPARSVLVVGAGHVGGAVASLLAQVGFRVVLCDARRERIEALQSGREPPWLLFGAPHDDPQVRKALGGSLERVAALVMTHDHELDAQVLDWALDEGFGFVGGVGSRSKAAKLRARWSAAGRSEREIDRLRMPLGVEIGARSPAEIAVSIVGELVAWRARTAAPRAATNDDSPSSESSD